MSVSQEPVKPKTMITPRSKRVAELLARRNFADMRQLAPIPAGDGVKPLRTLKHINRRAPADLESFRQALNKVPEFQGSIGFSFEKTATGEFTLSPLHSLEQVQREFPRAFAPPAADPEPLGNIFDDVWDTIENAAEKAWEAAKKVAVFIADQVTAVIDFADAQVKKVVNSIKEAVDAVVHIIKMIEALIEDVIRILMLLFDWSGILKTQQILKTISQNQLKIVKELVSAPQKDKFQNILTGVFARKVPALDPSKHESAQVSGNTSNAQHNDPHVQAQVNSVNGKYVNSKMDEHRDETVVSHDASADEPKNPVDDAVEANVLSLSDSLGGVLGDPLGVGFGEVYDGIKSLVSGDISKFGTQFTQAFLANHNVLADLLTEVETVIDAEIDIPFLSQLYKWITGGHTLTLLDVSCLALAIPTQVGYGIFTDIICGEVRKFSDDAEGLIHLETTLGERWGISLADAHGGHSSQPGNGVDHSLAHRDHNLALHWSYFAFNLFYTGGAGVLKYSQVSGPRWRTDKTFKALVSLWYVEGVVAKSLIFTAGQKEGGWNDEELAWNSTLFGVLVCLDLYTIYDVWMSLEPTYVTRTMKMSQTIKGIASLVGVVLLGIRLDVWINHKSDIHTLFHVRGLLEALAMMLAFDDTPFFVKKVDKETALYVVCVETSLKLITCGVHIAGIMAEVKAPLPTPELPA